MNAPPGDVQKLDACPPRVTCRSGGDYFSQAWLTSMGDGGPVADSVVYCNNNPALRLPNMRRLPGQGDAEAAQDQQVAQSTSPSPEELARQAVDEAVTWARNNGVPVAGDGCEDRLPK